MDMLKEYNIKDCFYLLGQAWSEIKSTTIHKVWCKTIFTSTATDSVNNNDEDDDNIPLSELRDLLQRLPDQPRVDVENIQTWCEEADSTDTFALLTDDEIIEGVSTDQSQASSDSEDEETRQEAPLPSHTDELNSFDTALIWLEAQDDANPMHLTVLRLLREQAASKRQSVLKQKDIRSFFKS